MSDIGDSVEEELDEVEPVDVDAETVWSGYVSDYYDDSIKPVEVTKEGEGVFVVWEQQGLRDDIGDREDFLEAYNGMSRLFDSKQNAAYGRDIVDASVAWPE